MEGGFQTQGPEFTGWRVSPQYPNHSACISKAAGWRHRRSGRTGIRSDTLADSDHWTKPPSCRHFTSPPRTPERADFCTPTTVALLLPPSRPQPPLASPSSCATPATQAVRGDTWGAVLQHLGVWEQSSGVGCSGRDGGMGPEPVSFPSAAFPRALAQIGTWSAIHL